MRALLDLLFPSACTGCGSPGDLACHNCTAPLHAPARVRMPVPTPPGLPPVYAVADYAGSTRDLVLAYKEREVLSLRRPLAAALASGLVAAMAAGSPPGEVVVVPVPSTRAALRRRGFDPVARLCRTAVSTARAAGCECTVVPALRHRRVVADSAGLSASGRAANLAGALEVRPAAVPRLAGRCVVLVDDVVTTGSTLTEAARAVRAAGAVVVAGATVAATVRRRGLARAGLPKVRAAHYGAGRGPAPAEEAPEWTSS